MPKESIWRKHFGLAIYSALLLALALAHIDIFARVAAQKIQWYEPHLAILAPTLLLVPIFFVIALYLELTFCFRKQTPHFDNLRKGYFALCVSILLLVLLSVFIFSIQLSETRGEVYTSQLLVFIFEPLLSLFFGFLFWATLSPGESTRKNTMKVFAENYLTLVAFITLCSLGVDIYLRNKLPSRSTVVQHSEVKPNIVLITLDTVRADHLSVYGYSKNTTPHLKALADSAVVFDQAHSTTSWTLPSHSSLFTGNTIETHRATGLHQKLLPDNLTLAEILRENGYQTAGFVGGGYLKAMYGMAQGFEYYSDRLDFFEYDHTYDFFSTRKLLDQISSNLRSFLFQNDGEKTAPELNKEIKDWLNHSASSPFFLFINYFDAHAPYNLGREYRKELVPQGPYDEALALSTVYNHQYDLRKRYAISSVAPALGDYIAGLYDSELKHLDYFLGQLLQLLKSRGLIENTILVITSDHGEEFLDHGGFSHSLTLYEEVLRIPLIISFPKKLKALRIPNFVSIIDVFPTLLGLIDVPLPKAIDGISLLPLIEGESAQSDHPLYASLYPNAKKSFQHSLILDGWKLLLADPEKPRVRNGLYDLREDSHEKVNQFQQDNKKAAELETLLQSKSTSK